MVEDHELSVGSEAVVTLMSQAAAVLAAVLGPVRDVNRPMGDISRVVDPGLDKPDLIVRRPPSPLYL